MHSVARLTLRFFYPLHMTHITNLQIAQLVQSQNLLKEIFICYLYKPNYLKKTNNQYHILYGSNLPNDDTKEYELMSYSSCAAAKTRWTFFTWAPTLAKYKYQYIQTGLYLVKGKDHRSFLLVPIYNLSLFSLLGVIKPFTCTFIIFSSLRDSEIGFKPANSMISG